MVASADKNSNSVLQSAKAEDGSLAANPNAISGKRLTLWVLVLLVVLGGTLVFALASFSGIDAARKQKREAWAGLREQMDQRYRDIEKRVAKGVDSRAIPMEWGEKFRLQLDAFRTTAQIAEQHKQALAVEKLLAEADFTLDLPAVEPGLAKLVSRVEDATTAEIASLQTPGGRLLGLFFLFDQPQSLVLAE